MSIKYFDLQINGYAGVDFNQDDLTASDLLMACQKLEQDGVESILATIITAEIKQMVQRIKNIVQFREDNSTIKEMIYGIHIEGPFLSTETGYNGAHNPKWIFDAETDTMSRLLEAADGLTRIVTLAPERDKLFKVTKMLSDNGIVVSAGHTNASLEVLNGAIDKGLSMFTHLGNGCPVILDRHDNIVQRVLSLRNKIWKAFIVDGIHIPPFALKNYLDTAGLEKSIVVTDAIAAASAEPGRFSIGEVELNVGTNGAVRVPGQPNLFGSSVTMIKSHAILKDQLRLSEKEIKLLTYDNPRESIGI
jgi:N-acetylglucosamine-6-phosphate deacetylase